MILTKEYINRYRTNKGAFTQSQVEALGLIWPPEKGWINRLVGTEISEENAKVFEARKSAKGLRQDAIKEKKDSSKAKNIMAKAASSSVNETLKGIMFLTDHDLALVSGAVKKEKDRRLKKSV